MIENEYEYIEHLSKRVADRAIKQIRGYLKETKDNFDCNLSMSKSYLERIENENRRTLDIRSEFKDFTSTLSALHTQKSSIFAELESYKTTIQLKFNRITDTMIEINELKAQLQLLINIYNKKP